MSYENLISVILLVYGVLGRGIEERVRLQDTRHAACEEELDVPRLSQRGKLSQASKIASRCVKDRMQPS